MGSLHGLAELILLWLPCLGVMFRGVSKIRSKISIWWPGQHNWTSSCFFFLSVSQPPFCHFWPHPADTSAEVTLSLCLFSMFDPFPELTHYLNLQSTLNQYAESKANKPQQTKPKAHMHTSTHTRTDTHTQLVKLCTLHKCHHSVLISQVKHVVWTPSEDTWIMLYRRQLQHQIYPWKRFVSFPSFKGLNLQSWLLWQQQSSVFLAQGLRQTRGRLGKGPVPLADILLQEQWLTSCFV